MTKAQFTDHLTRELNGNGLAAASVADALEGQHKQQGMGATTIDWAKLLAILQAILPILLPLFQKAV